MEGYAIEFHSIQRQTLKAILFSYETMVAWIPKSCVLELNETKGIAVIKDGFDINWKEDGVVNTPTTAQSRLIVVDETNKNDLWEYI